MKVSVPQKDGEITLTTDFTHTQRTYKVTDGTVTVKAADAPTFLWAVPGSKSLGDDDVSAADAPENAGSDAVKAAEIQEPA